MMSPFISNKYTTITSSVSYDSAVANTSNSTTTVTSIIMSPGTWLVSGVVCYRSTHANTSYTILESMVNTAASAPVASAICRPGIAQRNISRIAALVPGLDNTSPAIPVTSYVATISSPTELFLLARATFSGASATSAAFGYVQAQFLGPA